MKSTRGLELPTAFGGIFDVSDTRALLGVRDAKIGSQSGSGHYGTVKETQAALPWMQWTPRIGTFTVW